MVNMSGWSTCLSGWSTCLSAWSTCLRGWSMPNGVDLQHVPRCMDVHLIGVGMRGACGLLHSPPPSSTQECFPVYGFFPHTRCYLVFTFGCFYHVGSRFCANDVLHIGYYLPCVLWLINASSSCSNVHAHALTHAHSDNSSTHISAATVYAQANNHIINIDYPTSSWSTPQ